MNLFPTKKEFLIFYLIQMSCKWEMFSQNLPPDRINIIIDNYTFCYKKYIKNKQLLPPKKWWRNMHLHNKLLIIDYIQQFSDIFNLQINI